MYCDCDPNHDQSLRSDDGARQTNNERDGRNHREMKCREKETKHSPKKGL